ncbi:hypothetical protein [Cellulomonas gelida]|uniref:hypothetical protein n=1 Tax=Cellulomonas gelida TaxID=1712 RepID=UPI0011417EEA|nr:hypothetical protein [Cellulomonas gelida]
MEKVTPGARFSTRTVEVALVPRAGVLGGEPGRGRDVHDERPAGPQRLARAPQQPAALRGAQGAEVLVEEERGVVLAAEVVDEVVRDAQLGGQALGVSD